MGTQDQIASSFLRALGAPDTRAMREAVKVWLRKEGISSVKRNNPWNLHEGPACGGPNDQGKFCRRSNLPGQIGVVNVAPGDRNVAVFSTLDAGVRANANNLIRLQNSGYGYDRVIAAARAGDAVRFLHALARSSWSAGRYGTRDGGANSLITMYNGVMGTNYDPRGYKDYGWGGGNDSNSRRDSGTRTTRQNNDGGASLPDNPFVRALRRYMERNKLDPASPITEDQFWEAMDGMPGMSRDSGEAQQIARNFIGKSWEDAISIGKEGMAGKRTDPLDTLAVILATLADPATWARILALLVGLALTAYGGVNLYRATA